MTRRAPRPDLPAQALLALGSLLFLLSAPLWAGQLLGAAAALGLTAPRLSLSPRRRRLLVAAAVLALAAAGMALGHWSSATFLTLMLGVAGWLKLAERSGPRDRFVAALAGGWLTALGLPSLPPDLALAALALGAALLGLVLSRDAPRPGPAVRRFAALSVILPALGLTALLFLFTPRITGDLGVLAFALDLPFVVETAEELDRKPPPEEDAGLEEFRAKPDDMRVLVADFSTASPPFNKFAPPARELYWRGPVYWTYRGGAWSVRPGFEKRAARLRTKLTGEKLEEQMREVTGAAMYDVTLFPNRGEFLYALDVPAFTPPSAYITEDWQLMNLNPVREMLTYRAMSYVQYRAGTAPDAATMALALQLPEGEEPRTRALGRALAAEYGPDQVEIARAGRRHFAQGYEHDRAAPPIEGADPVDRFVFEEKRGYGMHFATAYALMMRAAGIPARVVSGYQGGLHMFLIEKVYVLEKDSHAWVEIYLEEHGWVRMDVARASLAEAERAADGLTRDAPAPEAGGETPEEGAPDGEEAPSPEAQASAPAPHWLARFDARMQGRLLEAAGLSADARTLMLSGLGAAAGAAGLWAAALGLLHWRRERRRPPAAREMDRFRRELARRGARRRPGEGLRSQVARLVAAGGVEAEEAEALRRRAAALLEARFGPGAAG